MKIQYGLVSVSIILVFFLTAVRPQSTQQPAKDLYTLTTTKNPSQQQHTPFVTMDKKSLLSGIRIEPEEQGGSGFIGYAKHPSEKGISIVEPDTPVRVVLFGVFLDEIDIVGFTNTDNCSDAVQLIGQNDFTIQSERRIVVIYAFESSHSFYKLCMRQKPNPAYPNELPIHLIDDRHCWVSTDIPAREYYFPMPIQIVIVAVLLVLSGLFSGLNLGLMSLTPQELTLIQKSGSPIERKHAQTILPVRETGNRLLCSLLIGNVCVNSAISILFDDLTSGYVALAVSSAGIVVFGEIFPQALCVKKGLAVGAHTIWVTRFFMLLTFPLAYPISRILDALLGAQVESYDRKRLIELIKLNTKNAAQAEELKIAIGAFEMNDKTVKDVMTKIDDVFMISDDTVLNAKVVAEIVRSGYTRIPVFSGSRDNVVSLLFVKDLALLDPDDNFKVETVCEYYQHPVRRVPENTPLRTMLEEFKKGDYHMALVDRMVTKSADGKDSKYELAGLVTLEDIVEEILQAEIVDETDVLTDNVHKIKRSRNQRRGLELFSENTEPCQISLQMQLVTIQFLEGTFRRAFHTDRISQPILEKVIRSHVHKVGVSHLADFKDPKTALPRKARLYVKKQPSDKFILILEGRAMVTIGQTEMKFEVGPWHYFGKELLQQLDQIIENESSPLTPTTGGIFAPTMTTTAQPPPPAIRTVTSAAGGIDGTLAHNRQSQDMLTGLMPLAGMQQQHMADLSQEMLKKVFFVPDYSVNIISECTYLEINVSTYASMYKSTQITRKNPQAGGAISGGGAPNEQPPMPPHHPHHHHHHRASLNQQPQQQLHRKRSPTGTMTTATPAGQQRQRRHSAQLTGAKDGDDQKQQQQQPERHSQAEEDEQQPLLTSANGPLMTTTTVGGGRRQKRVDNFLRTGSNASTTSGGRGGLLNGVRTTDVSLDEAENGTGDEHSRSGGGYDDEHDEDDGGDAHNQQGENERAPHKQQLNSRWPSSNYLPFGSPHFQ